MKTIEKKRLALTSETLRTLARDELVHVNGGAAGITGTCPTVYSCTNCVTCRSDR